MKTIKAIYELIGVLFLVVLKHGSIGFALGTGCCIACKLFLGI